MKRILTGLTVLSLAALAAACGEEGGSNTSASSNAGGGGTGGIGNGGTGGIGNGGAGGAGGEGGGIIPPAQPVSPYIVVDQFGYLPSAQKIAVIRDPETGFDAGESFTPGGTYVLVDAQTGAQVGKGSPTPWNGGAVDASSGDKAHWFDFSSVDQPGSYYVLDVDKDVRSNVFRIGDDVYRDVLKHAVRTFFYQRAGFEKKAEHAGAGWADGASHVGPGQDKNARLYSAKDDATTERDLSGGWYDAGDYNKYTNWTARYVVTLLKAYQENPAAFTDDYGIPESGNGVPDVIDEVKWGMDWLVRMQNPNGSVLSIVGMAHASPPSASQGPSLYGSASTSATLSTAAAYALGAKIFRSLGQTAYADDLLSRAKNAYTWANSNPNVTFKNNDGASGTSGLGAGQQEMDDYGRLHRKIEAAVYLFEETKDNAYRSFVDANYNKMHMFEWNNHAYPFEADEQGTLLYYTKVPNATANVVSAIKSAFGTAMDGGDNFPAIQGEKDPYRAYLKDYVWGSNHTKSQQGNMFYDIIAYGIDAGKNAAAEGAALRYLHYIHGVNPLGMVYLSNMSGAGADKSVNEFYHAWFADGSAAWDRVGDSTYGPAPGFLVGGPNPSYDWDGCCPGNCGSAENNAVCNSETLSPPKGQPAQKSYKDFNTSWPLNSWSVTENSNGYQVAYIRLLSKFVK
ncbi:glycoside hydrolase family 9 protein [Polyangium aurulentum]|uniref:glycoside hydrolase family 9 protein n=1 Tax=Polyangium aurulentum TaxID=2567896 RepID=UPI0010AE7456|nr:glycoside hydrolase family 9 protein [Polyangium aurulentum]UQA60047.1 glycoside hydrolase family 9 protein [Polyangium aurulentum]